MREILFRGKRIDNDEWAYGSFCMDAIEQKIGPCGVDGFIRLFDFAKGKTQTHEVDRETVGQYTGLTDKNGKKIFEGDVVRYTEREFNGSDSPRVGKVEFSDGGWAVNVWYLSNWLYDSVNGNVQLEVIEVIGNIHDNPELLEDAQ